MAGVAQRWIEAHVGHLGDDCLIWPFSSCGKGYGQAWFRGRLCVAHRAMCIAAHGEPPSKEHHAAHSCGVRKCVNPSHIRWATASENEQDKRIHGTSQVGSGNGAAKLDESNVIAIRYLIRVGKKDPEIAAAYGVVRETIRAIRLGKTWRHTTINEGAAA